MKKFMIVAAAVALSVAPVAAFADGGDWMPWQSQQVPAPQPPRAQAQAPASVAQLSSGTSHMYFTVQPKPTHEYNPEFGGGGNG